MSPAREAAQTEVPWRFVLANDDFRYDRTHLEEDLIVWEVFGSPTPEQWRSVLSAMEDWLTEAERRGRRLRLVLDPSGMTVIAGPTRRLFGQWRAENGALIANSVACGAYVASSPLVRAVLMAAFWFAPPVVPVHIASTREDALRWVGGQVPRSVELSLPSF